MYLKKIPLLTLILSLNALLTARGGGQSAIDLSRYNERCLKHHSF
jgi:hypothetical protein